MRGVVRLYRQAQIIEQRRVNRLRAGRFAVEREQITAPLALRELNEERAEYELSDTQRNQLFFADGNELLELHVAHDQVQLQHTLEDTMRAEGPHPSAFESEDGSEVETASPDVQRTSRRENPAAGAVQKTRWSKAMAQPHRFQWVLEHRFFTYAVSLAVVLNAAFIFFDEEQQSSANVGEPWGSGWGAAFVAIDVSFDTLFFAEVLLRLVVEGLAFFCQPWNLLDFVLVTVAVGGKLFTLLLDSSQPRWVRVFRLGRLIWLLHLFESLWIIIVGVASAMRTIIWAFILLFIIIYVFGILSARMIGQALSSDSADMDPSDVELIREWFGGIPQSMFTLLTMMTMEGWADIVRKVAQYQAAWCYVFFFLFFSLTTWGLMNMVMAVIIDATVGKALHHLENYVKVTAAERHEAIKKICDCFFLTGLTSGDQLSKEQFVQAVENKEFICKLHEVGIDAHQAHTLFDLLDFNKSGTLSLTEFTEGVLEARGKGHAMDVLRLKYDLQRYFGRSQKTLGEMHEGLERTTTEVLREARALREMLEAAARGQKPQPGSTATAD